MLFMMLISLYTSRIVLSTLGIEDFGIFNVVGGIVTMLTFLNSSMTVSTQRYLKYELACSNHTHLASIFSTSINIHITISIIIIILSETVGIWLLYNHMSIPHEKINAALWVFQLSILSTVIMIMSVPYNAIIIAYERMGVFAYISILEAILKLVIVYVLLVFNKIDTLKLYAVLMCCIQIIIRFIYTIYCKKNFPEIKYKLSFNRKLFNEMINFASWNLIGNIAVIAYTQGLNILLNIFFSPVINAARGIAVQVQNTIRSFCQNFQTALNPQITKSYATKDFEYMSSLIYASSKYSFFLLFFISLPILIETKENLNWWLKEVPEHTTSFARLIICTSMIEAISNPLITAVQATGKIKRYQIIIGSIQLSILPISYIALSLCKIPEIAFIVNLVIITVAQIARIFIVKTLMPFSIKKYFKTVIYKIILVCSTSYIPTVILYYILPNNNFFSFISLCIFSIILTSITIYTLGLDDSEKKVIKNKATKIYNYIIN